MRGGIGLSSLKTQGLTPGLKTQGLTPGLCREKGQESTLIKKKEEEEKKITLIAQAKTHIKTNQ